MYSIMNEQENKNMFAKQENETLLSSQNEQNNPNKNVITVVVLILILLIGGFFVYKNKITKKMGQETQEIKTIVTPEVTRVSEDKLQKEMPVGFPKDIPLNGKIKNVESYSATYPNSTAKQATISFESKNTPKQNYDFYLKFAKDNKWELISSSDQETMKSIYLRKDNKDLNIIINDKISITYVEV